MTDSEYTIEVIRKKCIGDGSCCDVAPYVFDMDDDACAIVLDPPLRPTPDEKILRAAKVCPVDAIILREKATGKQLVPEPKPA